MANEAKNTAGKSPEAAKKPNKFTKFFGRIKDYLHDCLRELKKIVWYGKKQTAIATVLVTFALIVFAVAVGGLDWGVNQLIQLANKIY